MRGIGVFDLNPRSAKALHAALSINPHWAERLFVRAVPGPDVRILDVGCGPATLWRANRERIDPTCRSHLLTSRRE
jgi:hypothetical protein